MLDSLEALLNHPSVRKEGHHWMPMMVEEPAGPRSETMQGILDVPDPASTFRVVWLRTNLG